MKKNIRLLTHNEIPRVWEIDRTELMKGYMFYNKGNWCYLNSVLI